MKVEMGKVCGTDGEKMITGVRCLNLKKTQLYRPGRRGEDNIKMYFNEKEL
jgi:hypothetical protein